MKRRLNLGAGKFKKKGFTNLDWNASANPDIVHNLNDFPYPFEDNTFDLIEADHVLEHLENCFDTMKELHRILKPGGILIIRVPHFSRGFSHPEHKRGFDVSFPLYFNKHFEGGFTGTEFELVKMRLNWFAQPYLKKKSLSPLQFFIGKFLGAINNLFANMSPYACSRIWCFWLGGFEEIEFIFKK